jgi:hypothetical protein
MINDQFGKILKGTLNTRFETFVSALKAASPSQEIDDWAKQSKENFKDILLWRDTVCHGSWRHEEGKMTVQFFDRTSLENEVDVPRIAVTIEELYGLSKTTLLWAISVANLTDGVLRQMNPPNS